MVEAEGLDGVFDRLLAGVTGVGRVDVDGVDMVSH